MTKESSALAARRAELERRIASLSPAKRALLEQGALDGAPLSPAGSDSAIPRRSTGATAPMSFAQELLWRIELADPGHGYNVPRTARLTGPLDVAALQRALDALVARHESLRTTFGLVDGEPRQIVGAPRGVPLETIDLGHFPEGEREGEALRRVRELQRRPFDLARDLQLRATVVRLATEDHVLLLESHHIVTDAVSRGIFLRELAAAYDAYREGREPDLAPLPVQYGDFAAWQRTHLAGNRLETLLAYWRGRLGDAAPLELPTDRPRPAAPEFAGATCGVVLPVEILEGLRRLSRAHGTTVFMTLLAAFDVLLARYSGQTDVVVGSPVAGRAHPELEGVIGYFVNTLVLRTSVEGDPTFAELLARVRESTLGAFEHQEVPYERLVTELRDAGRAGNEPLFNVLFALQDPERANMTLGGTRFAPFGADRGATKFDLFLSCAELASGLRTAIQYRTDLFDAATIERMLGHLRVLLTAAIEQPDERVSRLPLLDETERRLVVSEWNDTALDYPRESTLVELIAARVARTPDAVAVEFGGATVTYAQLDARAARLAAHLRTLGVAPETVVALYVERSIEMVVALLAIQRAGGAYLPLDPDYPQPRIEFMLADSGTRFVVTQESLRERLPALDAAIVSLDGDADAIAANAPGPAVPADPHRLAYRIYTSGSTGVPKGVDVTQGNVVNFLVGFGAVVPLTEQSTLVAVTPLSFDIHGLEIFLPLISGARLVVASRDDAVAPSALAALLAAASATHLQATPATWRMLVESGWAGQRGLIALCGGEALPPALAAALLSRGLELWNLYGPTEATIWATMHRVTLAADETRASAVSIGRPKPNVQVYILDRAGAPAPIGVAGELVIGGAGIARGYHQRPELTAERFVPDLLAAGPASSSPSGARLYRTGDLARWRADGTIDFIGRLDHQIKLRGHRIELGEIEHALADQPDVAAAVTVVREDTPGDARLVAYVVPRADDRDETGARVERWAQVWGAAYMPSADPHGERVATIEPGFNTSGWDSSYDFHPIPGDEMRAWRDAAAARVLATRPRRVLDVGCGTGLFLFRIAPEVERYVGVDASGEALRAIARDPAFAALRDVVTLEQARAHDLAARFAPGSFDVVVFNSVVQYFPSVDYLVSALEQAARLVAPGGTLFVGDVRALPSLELFHESVAIAHVPAEHSLGDVRAHVRERMAHETELVIDPAFFAALCSRLPDARECRLLAKGSSVSNELTRYRYDVVIRLGGEPALLEDPTAVPAHSASSLDEVRKLLVDRPGLVHLVDLPDARLRRDLDAHAILRAATGDVVDVDAAMPAVLPATVGELRRWLSATTPSGVDVAALESIDPEYEVELRLPASGRLGCVDAMLRHRTRGPARFPAPPLGPARQPLRELVHSPATDTFDAPRVAAWRNALGERLPDYMVPSLFVRLEKLPLTPNGKIDRKALPAPSTQATPDTEYVAPRSLAEARLAEIWEEVLQRRPIGIRDDFFALGGHSLLALRILARITERLSVRLPLRALFDAPTVEQLAAQLTDNEGATGETDTRVAEPDAIAPVAGDTGPATHGQELLWLFQRNAPESSAYHIPDVWRVRGALDADVLQRALDVLVQRHPALRTVIALVDGSPVQSILAPRSAVVERASVEALDESQRLDAARAIARETLQRPFDLATDAPFRAAIVRLGAEDHVVALVAHHVALDGWSRAIVLRELVLVYDALRRGEAPELPELPLRYLDWAAWQRQRLAGPAYERQLRYWTDRLAGASLAIDLPTDRPRTTAPRFVGARHTVVLPAGLLAALREIARAHDATLYMVLLAAFQTLLHRYSGQARIVVGTVVAGRPRADLERIVGYFVNTLALDASFDDDPTFADLLARVRDGQLAATENADVPFEQLARTLQQGGGAAPGCQVMFALQNNAPVALRLGDATLESFGEDGGTAKFDLYLSMGEQSNGLRAALQYRTDLFDAATIERMLGHLGVLLDGIARDPRRAVSRLPLLDEAERALVVERWNATDTDYPRDALVHELFAAEAARRPHAVAVRGGADSLTYAELDAASDTLAARLIALGVRDGDRVGLCLDRSLGAIVATLAVLKAGAAYVPLEPGYPAERLGFMVADTAVRVVVAHRRLATVAEGALALGAHRCPLLFVDERGRADDAPDGAVTASVAGPARADAARRAAYVMYTSGSTGRPKGVVVPHRAIVRLVRDTNYLALDDRTVMLGFAPSAFDAATLELWGPLLNGGQLVLAPAGLLDLDAIGTLVEQAGVTTLWLTAALFHQVVEGGLARYRGVRHLLAGGDVLAPADVRRVLAELPGTTLINGYGPTENTTFTCCYPVPRDWPATGSVPIGAPIANTRVYVLDVHGAPVPVGVPGELYAGGDGVALGYLGRPELTAERFVPDAFSCDADARLYRTGDRVRWRADGTVEFLGRLDQQVKIRGFRVEPGEVESVLAGHPAVRDAAIVAAPHEGGYRLVAYVVAREAAGGGDTTAPLSPASLRAYLRERLPEYMVPAVFVPMVALPVGATGKVDRRALPAPPAESPDDDRPFVEPRGETERRLAAIWAEVLGLDRVGADRNFFELGGHSLTAMRIMSRVQETFGARLPLTAVFERPTVAECARMIDESVAASGGRASGTQSIARVARTAQRRPAPKAHSEEGPQ